MGKMDLGDIQIDAKNLYREETFTDLQVGSIQKLSPVHVDGTPDNSRPAQFVIRTQLMSPMGPVPVHAPVEAATIEEVIAKFPQAVQEAVEQMVREAEAMQREQASRIVVPGRGNTPDIKLV